MFGNLIVWYLFLGGLSAGAVLFALVLRWWARSHGGAWSYLDNRVFCPLIVLALLALATGCVCLLGDLRRPQAAHLLFINPTLNVMNVGALLLAAFIAALLAMLALDCAPARMRRGLVRAVEVLAAVLALAVATYTGVYLHSFWTVMPWSSPLLVLLFVLSSLSTGCAGAYFVMAAAVSSHRGLRRQLVAVERADVLLVAAEALVLIGMFAHLALARTNAAADLPSLLGLLSSGSLAGAFWLGFVGCALVAPLLAAPMTRRLHIPWRPRLCVQGAALLVGGYFLRYCMIEVPVLYKAVLLAAL